MNGIAAEFHLNRLLISLKCKPVKISAIALIKVAENTAVGRHRINMASRYLIDEYGVTRRKKNGALVRVLDWCNVPSGEVLDKVYGIDTLVNYRGWIVAIDCTVNPDSVSGKQSKMVKLTELYKSIGIDVSFPILLDADTSATDIKREIRYHLPG